MTTPEAHSPVQESISAVELEPVPAAPDDLDLHDKSLYIGRELSWLDFNERVLRLTEDADQPLLERVKLAAIWGSNLDEFFQIRVAGVHDQIDAGLAEAGPDGLTPSQTIDAIRTGVLSQQQRLEELVLGKLFPALAEEGIRIVGMAAISESDRAALGQRFRRQIFPVLTPLAVGQGRPFPYISSLSLSIGVLVRDPTPAGGEDTFARVKVPTEMLPRFVALDDDPNTFVTLEEVIAANLDALFPGMQIVSHGFFRVTRDADFEVSDEADDLLQAVEAELRRRRFGEAVRLEVDAATDPGVRELLREALDLEQRQVYDVDGILDTGDLWQIYNLPGFGALRDPPWTPVTQPRLQGSESEPGNVMAQMRMGDILVHHPYDSFATSVERFVAQAAADPDVLAIKQTVYRTSDDSSLGEALMAATERGKQAVCMVELKARFDERANIGWARALEQAGVHVVYGYPGLKTHAKCVLVVRREGDGVRHYVHIGTGNYHPKTARLYTDFGLFTCDEDTGNDVADMFNFLTGLARPSGARTVLIAPNGMREGIIAQIDKTIEAHERGQPARIRLKMNSLVDRRCIRALYRASRAGVPVQLNVRGICCLRPGVEGVSENISVVSVLGRFLEHSRIYSFEQGDETTVLIGSADLMPRNLDTRVELITPVADAVARADLLDTLDRSLATDQWAWELQSDGAWHPREPGDPPRSVQRELMLQHAARASEGSQPSPGRVSEVEDPAARPRPQDARVHAPPRGNRRLAKLLDAVDNDLQVKAWWHATAVNAERLHMSDHSWVHIQVVLNIALRLSRLLLARGVTPSIVADHGLEVRDAEVVIAGAALLHCVGMSIHRTDHETYSLFLTADKLGTLLADIYDEPTRSIVIAETMHAIISHRSKGAPFTIEGAIVRVADALDMARGRSRVPFEAGHTNIHSLSAYAIEEVKIGPGEDKAVRVEIEMSNSAGIFQVDEGLGTKLRGTPLEEHIEVVARISAEHEQRLVPIFRL